MKVVSTNLGKKRIVNWRGKPVETGIFKESVSVPLQLGEHDVSGDTVVDRKYHGGVDKACYLYSADHYPFWQEKYPEKELPFGMFGENLTVEGLDETNMVIGSTYEIGTAKVQVSEPRQPCYKLGIRFNDQGILKPFINSTYSGVYLRVIEPGTVSVGDEFQLLEPNTGGITIAEVYQLIYVSSTTSQIRQKLMADTFMPDTLKVKLVGKLGVK